MIRFAARLLTLLLAFGAGAGCGGRRGAPEGREAARAVVPTVTMCWVSAAPALAMEELAVQYQKEAGVRVRVVAVHRREYHDQIMGQFAGSGATPFALVAGMSHWTALGVQEKLYADLSEFLKRDVGLADVHPRLREVLGEYPPQSGLYPAVPLYPDLMGLAYRADWFSDPAEQAAFRERYKRPLAPPRTWAELRDVAEFFHRPAEGRYGVSLLTSRKFDGIVPTFQQILYSLGGTFANPTNAQVRGYLDGPIARQSLDLLRELLRFGPPGAGECAPGQSVENFVRGRTAMSACWLSMMAGIEDALGAKAGFAPVPGALDSTAVLEGYGLSIAAAAPLEQQELARQFIQWFLKPANQERWLALGGLPVLQSQWTHPAFTSRPYADVYTASVVHATGFWNVPVYVELMRAMQKAVGDALDGYVDPDTALYQMMDGCGDALRERAILREY